VNEHAPLPRSLLPLPGESLPGLLLRLAHRLDQRPADIALRAGLAIRITAQPANHLLMLAPQFRPVFTHVTRIPERRIDDLTLRSFVAHYPPVAEALTRPGGSPQLRPRSYFPPWLLGASTRYCPLCLAGDGSEIQRRHGGAWKTQWRLGAVFVCLEHRLFLQDICPACGVPALGGTQKKLILLPAPTTGGLHPAQCRSVRADGTACGHRMDNPDHLSEMSRPSPRVIALQQHIQDLLSPAHDPADAFAVFSDLQVMSAIVQTTWPATATVTPERHLVQALDAHITEQRQLQSETLPRVRRSNLWVTPPLSASATAGLLDIATRLLDLNPRTARRLAITALADRMPLPTSTGWGKTWTILRRDCSSAFRTQMIEALPRPFHPHGASPLTAWRRARQPLLPVRSRGYLPEHIPQWLPDDWFTAAGLNPSEPFLGRSVVFRRFAAVQLVQMATGMLFEKAAYFLGIPESWHQTPERLKRLTPRDSLTHHTDQLPAVIEQLGRHAAQLTTPVNHRSRRLRFGDWTLSPGDWTTLNTSLGRSVRTRPRALDMLNHTCASSMIWTRLTGSEWRLAPSALVHYPDSHPADFDSEQATQIRWQLAHPDTARSYYQRLHRLLIQHSNDLIEHAHTV